MEVLKMSNKTTAKDMELCLKYFPSALPITFTYAGKVYHGMPENSTTIKRIIDSNMRKTVITGNIDSLGIKAELITYRDYPVVEWTVYFTCCGEKTEILEDVFAADINFDCDNPILVYNNGDTEEAYLQNYTESHAELKDGVNIVHTPKGGRPCDRAFPYQRVLCDGFGMNISIGWPGQWISEYNGSYNGFNFKAGQETVHTYINCGETFRTPRMTVMLFEGDEQRGINLWRRWFNAHVTPKNRSDLIQPYAFLCENNWGIEFTKADETNQVEAIKYASENLKGINLWWLDAGWYPCKNKDGNPEWPQTGSWFPDPERFPNGLAPVGKACKEAGYDFLVWFEPERVRYDSWLHKNHPEWLFGLETMNEHSNFMLNLANPECNKWLCEHISGLIKESGIKCYRQDFNFKPLPYWRWNEEPDRKGMIENQYIQGYLAYWDYLLFDNPDLFIDSCASGGRRNDLETLRRSVPLHPTDYAYGYHHVNQAFRHTLNAWIPYTRGWMQSWDKDNEYYSHGDYYMTDTPSFDNFKLINGFGTLSNFGIVHDYKELPEQIPYVQKILDIWHKFTQIQLNGDFYALTLNHRDNTKWTVFQFDRPESGDGVFQVLCNNQAQNDSITVKPFGFDETKKYELVNEETGEKFTITGSEVTFTQPLRSGAIWFYRISY